MEENPYPNDPLSDGILMIVLDGGRKDMMSNPEFMPKLNERVKDGAYMDILTNPITMTASCVKEMATGVPSRPNEGLNNFHPVHPGTPDGWNLASVHDGDNDGEYDHQFGILGDYVWKDLYPDREIIPFLKHRYGHADYYNGDEEGFETLYDWLEGDAPEGYDRAPNLIVAHLSGLDSVGHRYGSFGSTEYEDKLKWLDDKMDFAFKLVPDNWTVIVTSDHGLTDSGQHGSDEMVIRETAGFMWGPNVAKGVVVDGMDQRDLATLPSMILGLPFPHAVVGKIPLDAFELTDQQYRTYEQWNWNAAVERNDWMEDNGHTYVEGLTKENIEWDKLRGDDIGTRDIDVAISIIAVSIFCIIFYRILSKHEVYKKYAIFGAGSVAISYAISALISFNRDTYTELYYQPGLIGLPLLYWLVKRDLKETSSKMETRLLAISVLLFIVLIYPESRFTMLSIPLFLALILVLENKMFLPKNDTTPKRLLIPTIAVVFTTIWYSDQRIHGFAISRRMIGYTQSYETNMVILSVIVAFVATIIYSTRNLQNNWPQIIAVSTVFATIPVMVAQDNNSVDWVIISGLILGLIAAIVMKIMDKEHSYNVFQYTAFAWLIMSWGAWAGGVSMLFYACIESLMNKEWKDFKETPREGPADFGRQIALGLIPIGIWFTWWASMGQIDGIFHPRDIDPGNLFLKGGYIGDRISPSNTWVFFMGACPVILIGILWWNLFRMKKWPLMMAFLLLSIRAAGLSLHLSISPSLPRLVFKIGWDLLFCLLLIGTSGLFILYDKWLNSNSTNKTSHSSIE